MMSIFPRAIGETVRIGTDIVVSIVGIKGGKVRIGFKAPEDVHVDREEIVCHVGEHCKAVPREGQGQE
jgi:carbon storage regulator